MAVAKKFAASKFWDDIRRFDATIFQYIGEICRYLLAQPKKENDGIYRRPLWGAVGNGLQGDIWEEFQTRFNVGQIFEFYGATEGVFSFINTDGKIGSVGRYSWFFQKHLDNVVIASYDSESGEPKRGPDGLCIQQPPGTVGLMLVKITERLRFYGYRGPEQVTARKIVHNVRCIGDRYFNSGDLMRIDTDRYVYFIDRLGDTFRWKGENVSTKEVSHVMNSFQGIQETNVYGVHVPGHEGRAGMAAIVLKPGFKLDLSGLYLHATTSLPEYARPKFLRILEKMDITSTFKHKKTELVKRGFAPDGYGEVYVIEPSEETFVPITDEHIKRITTGHSRL